MFDKLTPDVWGAMIAASLLIGGFIGFAIGDNNGSKRIKVEAIQEEMAEWRYNDHGELVFKWKHQRPEK